MTEIPRGSRAVQQRLVDAGVETVIRELPESTHTARDAAAALGCPLGAIASSLVFLVDGEPVLAVTSGAHRVAPARLAAAVDGSDVTMASAKQVRTITGQPIGGVAPVGHPAPLRTVIDESLRGFDPVFAAAGTPNTLMALTFGDLCRLTGGAVAAIGDD